MKYESGNETVDLDGARYGPDPGSDPVASGRQRLTLAEGQRHMVDLLHASPGTAGCNVTLINLEIEATASENPRLADTLLQYDLWLVRRDANGAKSTHHVITTGLQGGEVPFAFAPVRFGVPKLVPDQFDFDVVSRVSGRIRGRVRDEGRIELDMRTSRSDDVRRRGGSPTSRNVPIGEGRKLIEVAPGEAVEIELPARAGSYTVARSAAVEAAKGKMVGMGAAPGTSPGPSEPFSIVDDRLVLNYARFFEGQPVSLIVQVKRVE